jgi:hypothetical protein
MIVANENEDKMAANEILQNNLMKTPLYELGQKRLPDYSQ